MPNKQSTAVKKAWSQANKLHKAVQLEGWDDQGMGPMSTPGLARRYNSLIKKGLVQIQGAGSKHKTLAYSKWLGEMETANRMAQGLFVAPPQSPASSEQPQISSEETNPAIVEDKPFAVDLLVKSDGYVTSIELDQHLTISLLENLSQTCKQFKVTPNELITHINILEQLQVLDTTCPHHVRD